MNRMKRVTRVPPYPVPLVPLIRFDVSCVSCCNFVKGRFSLTAIKQSTALILLILLHLFTTILTSTPHHHNSQSQCSQVPLSQLPSLLVCFLSPHVLRTELTLIVGGFVLLLLVTLSVPIAKSIHLLVVDMENSGVRMATFGVFGACYEGVAARLVRSTHSSFV